VQNFFSIARSRNQQQELAPNQTTTASFANQGITEGPEGLQIVHLFFKTFVEYSKRRMKQNFF
jgi:hypothetical protein